MDNLKICPQCFTTLSAGPSRLVQDACGHKKCRLCLLKDEETCKQCISSKKTAEEGSQSVPITHTDFHTTVITYQKKSENASNKSNEKPSISTISKVEQEKNEGEVAVMSLMPQSRPIKDEEGRSFINSTTKEDSLETIRTNSHITFDLKSKSYTCSVCKKSFTEISKLEFHNSCNREERPFACDICNQGFLTKSHHSAHLLLHQKSKPYKCLTLGCGKAFSERSKLNRHQLIHGNNRPFICQECGKSFKIKENLRTHSMIHKKDKPYACTECNLRFNHSSNLKKHLAVHTSDKTHMCDQCGKCFKLKWALTMHRRIHNKTRTNNCSICNKSFVHLKDLTRHKLVHAESKGYRCGICGSTFRRKDNLNRHSTNTHPEMKPQIIECVDTPNAIKVITTQAAQVPAAKVEGDDVKQVLAVSKAEDEPLNPILLTTNNNGVNVPLKLAFKTYSFTNHGTNKESMEPNADQVSIYQKILKPRSDVIRTTTSNAIRNNVTPIGGVFEEKALTLFDAPAHYETSFDNKQHAVIKNIKFKLPDKYTNLNTVKDRPKNDGDKLFPISVIVNNT